MDDAIATCMHSTLTHLEHKQKTYILILFRGHSFAFNTIVHSKLTTKLKLFLGLEPSLCNWTSWPTDLSLLGNHTSSTLTLSTGAAHHCVLSRDLYSHFTHNCLPIHNSKFADDTRVGGRNPNKQRDPTCHITAPQQACVCRRWRSWWCPKVAAPPICSIYCTNGFQPHCSPHKRGPLVSIKYPLPCEGTPVFLEEAEEGLPPTQNTFDTSTTAPLTAFWPVASHRGKLAAHQLPQTRKPCRLPRWPSMCQVPSSQA